MSKVNDLLKSRFKSSSSQPSKMSNLAEMSSSGELSSFSGVFRVTPLTENEEETLRNLLIEYNTQQRDIAFDLKSLSTITSEVKAINNQAAILHGERIKQAQNILKKYKDGAFTSWLIHTYGNRQTPYNFLQYFELYNSIPKSLQNTVDLMPRQAIYALATRKCSQQNKEEIIKNYKGESKKELLHLIRKLFPLSSRDKRASNLVDRFIRELKNLEEFLNGNFKPSEKQKKQILEVLQSIQKKL